ncbi:hypothetical protein ETD86_37065 [Nonomuraea turkmeniaca]|uniref:Uncharacterized protein n=1 Tax=Nonomuraea turkmeniaca TaxID=103838 RepID=A0A5S4F4R9_9ACTN|nr:hypothetical protein [Nonomuraea turkmeniaca]TMR11057.1 hypothetical protein ETD86_37065 [Nonomuraea turkmeniaca]
MTSLDQNITPLSAQRLAEIRRNQAEVADYIAHGLMRSNFAYQDRTDLLAEVDRLNTRIAWLDDYIAGVGGISCVPEHPDGEVERLNATLERVQAVADKPVHHQCDRDGRVGWVRLRDLQEALKDGAP